MGGADVAGERHAAQKVLLTRLDPLRVARGHVLGGAQAERHGNAEPASLQFATREADVEHVEIHR